MLVMVVFFIAFRWIHLSTPLIRLFLLVLILLLMPTLNFLHQQKQDRKSGSAGMPRPRSTLFPYTTLFRSHCIQMDTSVNAANQVVSVGADIAFDADPKFFAPTETRSEERFSRNAETEIYTLSLHDALPISLHSDGYICQRR